MTRVPALLLAVTLIAWAQAPADPFAAFFAAESPAAAAAIGEQIAKTVDFDTALARVKQGRRSRLMSLQKRLSARRNRARLGQRLEVLVEGAHPESDWLLKGRLAGQAPEIDGGVILNDGTARPGEFVTCEITDAHAYDLVGRIVGHA